MPPSRRTRRRLFPAVRARTPDTRREKARPSPSTPKAGCRRRPSTRRETPASRRRRKASSRGLEPGRTTRHDSWGPPSTDTGLSGQRIQGPARDGALVADAAEAGQQRRSAGDELVAQRPPGGEMEPQRGAIVRPLVDGEARQCPAPPRRPLRVLEQVFQEERIDLVAVPARQRRKPRQEHGVERRLDDKVQRDERLVPIARDENPLDGASRALPVPVLFPSLAVLLAECAFGVGESEL